MLAEKIDTPAGLSALIASSPVASVISNPRLADNPIIACNKAFIDLTGYPEHEVVGRNCRFLAGPATEPRLTEMIREGVREQRPVLVEILNYKKDGTLFYNRLKITPLFDKKQRIIYYPGVQYDMTEQVQANNEIRELNAIVAMLSK